MPNHAPATKLWDGKTHLWQSFQPRKLIFFVHGFGGENTATWFNFPALMIDDGDFAEHDLLFYGYRSQRQAGSASSGLLFQNCDDYLSNPAHYASPLGYPRRTDFEYGRVIFVAHSLGAPVVRAMLLQAHREQCRWLSRVSLIFFAPATAGARVEMMLRLIVAATFLEKIRLVYEFRRPVVQDLRVGSSFLQNVRDTTIRLLHEGHSNFRSQLTMFGALENIIDLSGAELIFDAPYRYIIDRNYVTVCKPKLRTDEIYRRFKTTIGHL